MYDAAIGRFTGVDPIADQFAFVSTYNYAENSPIANIDLWGLQAWFAGDGSLLAQGPLTFDAAESMGAESIGFPRTVQDFSFTNEEINSFSLWNSRSGPTELGDCLGCAVTGAELLTGADVGWRNARGNNDLNGRNLYDLGESLENLGFATEIATEYGGEINSLVNNGNFANTENTAFLLGPAQAFHSMILVHNTASNTFSLFDQGTGWAIENTTQNGAHNQINSVINYTPSIQTRPWRTSRSWQLNKQVTIYDKYMINPRDYLAPNINRLPTLPLQQINRN